MFKFDMKTDLIRNAPRSTGCLIMFQDMVTIIIRKTQEKFGQNLMNKHLKLKVKHIPFYYIPMYIQNKAGNVLGYSKYCSRFRNLHIT